ncbi:MAG TPA: SO2930 family diheme c-type cytochrome [Polyangiaceae bacterium]|jgi:uncharacterized repeat protein (TIGR03806 family)|nr:SO2930 family diheme c-type cytochrome [Polyangiaceae bacterium]
MASVFAGDKRRVAAAVSGVLLAAACSTDSTPSAQKDASAPHVEAGAPDAAPSARPDAAPPPSHEAGSGVTKAPEDAPFSTLAEWHLFTDPVKQTPADGVVPYDVNSQLFADYASKRRFIYVPAGEKIGYSATDKWAFPVGTILVKTFSYLADLRDATKGERLLETRLLIHEADGWVPHTYVWNDAQTTATLDVAGQVIDSQFIDATGKTVKNGYTVPSGNDCRTCHGKLGETDTLGGRTRQLDRDNDYGNGAENQVDHLAKLGLFDKTPEPEAERQKLVDPFGTAPIFERVRSYFDGNCSQCHQPGNSPGSLSGLWLDYASTASDQPRVNWGFCKQPASAGGATCGRQFDVVPGNPDDSIMTCRLESQLAKVKMPPVGRNLVHAEAVSLMHDWITGVDGACGRPTVPPADAGSGDAGPSHDAAVDHL